MTTFQEILKNRWLIIIPYSGFNQEEENVPRVRLKSFISFFAESDTRFLIYSRRTEAALQKDIDNLMASFESEHPGLLSLIDVFGVDDYGPRNWLSPVTANALKLRVKEILKETTN